MTTATLISIGSFDTLAQATLIASKCEKKLKRKLKHDKYLWAKYSSEIDVRSVCTGGSARDRYGAPLALVYHYIPRIHIAIDMPQEELLRRLDAELTRDLADIAGHGFYIGRVC